MSIVRFSSECYKSDVHIYERGNGYQLHIAVNRRVSDEPRPNSDLGGNDYLLECQKWLESAKLVPIGLPHDGKSFFFEYWGECLRFLKELRDMGYYIPDYVFDFEE